MKALLTETLSTALAGMGFMTALFVVFYSFYEIGRRNAEIAKEYEKRYSKIKRIIEQYPIVKGNYDYIFSELIKLADLKYKDPERSEVLANEFFAKYKQIKKANENQNVNTTNVNNHESIGTGTGVYHPGTAITIKRRV